MGTVVLENFLYSFNIFRRFFWCQGDIGLNVAQMLVELIRDNRKIVDRITQDQIRMFVDLLQVNKVRETLYLNAIVYRHGDI